MRLLQQIIAALDLSTTAFVNHRVPKKLLFENGAPTAADKRQINDDVEEIQWVAALKPNTTGVVEYRDDQRQYLEIAVLAVILRGVEGKALKASRIAKLVHRAVPYPMLLMMKTERCVELSVAHKRWAQNEVGKVVLDGEHVSVSLETPSASVEISTAFLQALSISCQPRQNLRALYQGWLDTLLAYQVAQLTGNFIRSETDEQTATRRAGLQLCRDIEQQITMLRTAAAKEKQLSRQVTLNLEIKQLQARQQQALELL